MSAAPEIALLAAAVPVPAIPPAGAPASTPLTLGTMARRLRMLAAAPERWWGLVRFDPARSVMIEMEDQPAYGAWLMILPPGDAGRMRARIIRPAKICCVNRSSTKVSHPVNGKPITSASKRWPHKI